MYYHSYTIVLLKLKKKQRLTYSNAVIFSSLISNQAQMKMEGRGPNKQHRYSVQLY